MGYELLLVDDVQHSPGYDQIIVDANREAELKDLEQDKTERAMNKDLGKGSEENILKVVERVPDIVGKTIQVKYDDQGVFKQSKLSPERGEKGTF